MKISFAHRLVAFLLLLILPVFVMKRYTLLKYTSRAKFDHVSTLMDDSHRQNEKAIKVITVDTDHLNIKTIESVFKQNYSNYKILVLSSIEEDREKVKQVATRAKETQHIHYSYCEDQFDLIRKFHQYVLSLKDDEIVMYLGENNYLADEHVFSMLNDIYTSENIYLCFGQYKFENTEELGISLPLHSRREWNLKKTQQLFWLKSPVKVFYAGLYKQLFLDEKDLATFTTFNSFINHQMRPMAELSKRNIRFVSDIMYVHSD